MNIKLTKDELRVIKACLITNNGSELQQHINDKKAAEVYWFSTWRSALDKIEARFIQVRTK